MTDQTIPADKVRELIERAEVMPSYADLLTNLRALLPAQQPTTGLLGRWAKHPEHGDVLCMWDKPSRFGKMRVAHVSEGKTSGAEHWYAEFDSLTFPHQTTRPEDVQPGEAWLMNIHLGDVFHQNQVALKYIEDGWISFTGGTLRYWLEEDITLVAPLTPEHPGTDLQARYDELERKHAELQAQYDKQ